MMKCKVCGVLLLPRIRNGLTHFVPVIFLECGLNLIFAHPPPGPDGGGDHLIFTDETVRVDIQRLFKETQMLD